MRRRDMLAGGLALVCAPAFARGEPGLAAIAARLGGRLGVAALDSGSGRTIGLAADARFAMCSTFKLPLVAAVLREVDAGRRRLDERVAFTRADMLDYAPVVAAHLSEGALPLATLCAAAVTMSDNAAANLLLPLVGGPAGLTRCFRAAGDRVSRLDRTEPTLNTNLPGDPRDTTTPGAMLGFMRRVLLGGMLAPASRALLLGWLAASSTGGKRLRAGLPPEWRAGDKTGTGARGAVNDVAIVWPPGRAPILIACYIDAPDATLAACEAAHAAVGALVAGRLG